MPLRFKTHAAIALILFFFTSLAFAQAPPVPAPVPGELTLARIFGSPSLGGHLNAGLAWAPDGKRLTYVETTTADKTTRQALWVVDAATGQRSVLVDGEKWDAAFTNPGENKSQATGLGRHAPPLYQWAPAGDAILFEGPTSLAWYDLKSQSSRVLVSGKQELADPKISPDGKLVSYVREHNLWVVTTADGKERALTQGGIEELRKGELDWVYPEELDITTAYWWAPDSSSVAFLEMDERKVTQFPLVDFASYSGEADLERYPVPGGANPIVHVYVVPAAGGEPRKMDTGTETNNYLPRVNWLPDSKRLAIQRLNREQNVLDLVLADASTGNSKTILTEKDPYWINVSDDLHFLKDSTRFVWSSERSGYRHLYLYDVSGKQLAQLTKGDWEVTQLDAVDESAGLVYFGATEKSPIERHLYRVSLDGSRFARLTKEDGTHGIRFSPDAKAYVDTYSNVMTPPRRDTFSADGAKLATLEENKVPELAEFHLSPVEFFTIQSHDGVTLNCSIIKPPHFDPSKKYPVITYTYGGPHAQVILNAWAGRGGFLWHQMMAQKGYIIFSLDNRGSAGRGHLFEEPIHYRLGAQELSDQRDGAAWLRNQPYVDPNRIGIWGWSYGGHMTLHAMFEAGEIYKAGFAGGPVTDWHYYDTIYTERYLGLLPQREEGYQESSPIKNADHLKGKLLIAHGTGDDNVHYSNTLALINDLISQGKYVEVIAFPGRGHGVSDVPAQRLLWERVTKFFLDNL
ncbi:MAG TPA: DPP IV N-terminal domain-containing protein [Terriglobales bacterium]|nr:DPP IV N-terminal domain-containing protein [Terriglobales bacterium]